MGVRQGAGLTAGPATGLATPLIAGLPARHRGMAGPCVNDRAVTDDGGGGFITRMTFFVPAKRAGPEGPEVTRFARALRL